MTTPLTVLNKSISAVSGSAVTLSPSQVVHTIRAFPPTGGMTLTMPTAASFFASPKVAILMDAQSDFTVINQSSSEEVTVVTPNSYGDLVIAAEHAAVFRMLWTEVVGTAKSFILYRIGGTDSTANLVTTEQLFLSSSQPAADDAILIKTTGVDGGITLQTLRGKIILFADERIELTTIAGIKIHSTLTNIELIADDGIAFVSGQPGISATTTHQIHLEANGNTLDSVLIEANHSIGGVYIKAKGGGIRLNTAAAANDKLGTFDTLPVIQRTAVNSTTSAVVLGAGSALLDDSTFGGYTVAQIVGAMQDYGLLA